MGFKLTKYSPAAGPRMRPRKPVSSGPISRTKKRDRSLITVKKDHLDRMIDSLDRDAIKSLRNKPTKRMTPMKRKNKY